MPERADEPPIDSPPLLWMKVLCSMCDWTWEGDDEVAAAFAKDEHRRICHA